MLLICLLEAFWGRLYGVRGRRGGGNRLRVRLGRRITRNACTGLTVVARSDSRFVLSFVHIVPKVPGTNIRSHVILTPRRTGHLLHTLRRGVKGCRHTFKLVHVPSRRAFPPLPGVGNRTWGRGGAYDTLVVRGLLMSLRPGDM